MLLAAIMNGMIAISLWQPHASAMFVSRPGDPSRMLKGIETRGWVPSPKTLQPGDRLAIHAAQTQRNPRTKQPLQQWWMENVKRQPELAAAFEADGIRDWCDLPFGKLLGFGIFLGTSATSDLIASGSIDHTEEALGDYSRGRFGWRMTEMTKLSTPLPCKGRQGFFKVATEAFRIPADSHQVTSGC